MHHITRAALSLLALLAPAAAWATPVYDLSNLYRFDEKLAGLEGWGMKVENFFGQGVYGFSVDNPGNAQLFMLPGTNQVHLLATLHGAPLSGGGAGAGGYTLNVMLSGVMTGAGGAAIAAGFGTGSGHFVVGTLTAPGGEVYHLATGDGTEASFTLGNNGTGLEAHGVLEFCSDAGCATLLTDTRATLAFGAACSADSDCTGWPGAKSVEIGTPPESNGDGGVTGADTVRMLSLALPPESPEVPEPGTYAMMTGGLIGLALYKRQGAGVSPWTTNCTRA